MEGFEKHRLENLANFELQMEFLKSLKLGLFYSAGFLKEKKMFHVRNLIQDRQTREYHDLKGNSYFFEEIDKDKITLLKYKGTNRR